ncbi:MAG TPA: hypothetical protein VJY85_10150 [Candidatus Limnocylindria bacterium]|nr:hypothetical protein [Candidatus Limnocylindria bacterium]
MPKVHVEADAPISADRVLAAARDFTEHRAELWPDVHLAQFRVHEIGDTYADVTEGNPWPIGIVWERLRYDWSVPGSIRGVVIDSNLFYPGSTWELYAAPTEGGSHVEIIAQRNLRPIKGWLTYPFFPLGIARQTVAEHLHHFLSTVEGDVLLREDSWRASRSCEG